MQLQHLSIAELIAGAHGDPWGVNRSLQSGRPAQISNLAMVFHDAGRGSAEANAAFDQAFRRFEAAWNREDGEHPINDSAEILHALESLRAQVAQLPKIAIDLENVAAALAEAQRSAGGQIATLEGHLQEIDDHIGKVLDLEQRVHLSAVDQSELNDLVSRIKEIAILDTKETVGKLESTRSRYSDTLQTSMSTLRTDGYDPAGIKALDAPGAPSKAEPEANRQQNQIDAFTKVFGRPPSSQADWDTAAALDPHSYNPKDGGVHPNIVVQRITPVPGQGVVRTNLFIPGHGVVNPQADWPPYHENLGDNRSFSATAGPESSRVAITVDYENGIIVTRQNPSVDAKTGQIRTGTPSVSAVQKSNGAVLISYSAADPMSPGGEALAKFTTFDVNGKIAIQPSDAGPRVGGIVTNFPAIEIYSDRAGATEPLVQAWPHFVDGPLGPEAGLWWHKDIGDPTVLPSFGDQRPGLKLPFGPIPLPGPIPIPIPLPIQLPELRLPLP
ncbi:hypothetical protein [Mycobacterium sp.]|uniref:putative alpha/beta hydrolase n=1 Tax=Mycobacterium sp. TaxID=1785 RepID=UPI0039C9D5D7